MKPQYNRGKTRRAMLIAPAIGVLGIAPFFLQLNLTIVQFLLGALASLVFAYIAGLIFGSPGYLVLRSLGYLQSKYLIAYAAVLACVVAILLGDIYALLTFGPPTLLAAGAFCLIRGPALLPDEA
jgi:hypothetical protein